MSVSGLGELKLLSWLLNPLTDEQHINIRQDIVELFLSEPYGLGFKVNVQVLKYDCNFS